MAVFPNLNAFAERFVRKYQESCLDRMVLLGSPASIGRDLGVPLHYQPNETIRAWVTKSIRPEFAQCPSQAAINVASGWAVAPLHYRKAA